MGFTQNTAMRQKQGEGSEVAVTSGGHAQNDKERQQWIDSDIRGRLKDPESGVASGRESDGCDVYGL